ncbi:arsenate-mycothiol transferase ArsC [Mobilicoccus pelagius]|uniref:Arsenate reductase n=1 Tax=Mobilicoccus pelagius NBRC 104925 TaxID=1089455 RepID=H5UQI3_9MICO|nr:low molecular weight phosphatase family protein [Mobilicoccus pelagius]GAB47991.1 arsenate reductase [Mobilicoccus pelagius NBRC 104925]
MSRSPSVLYVCVKNGGKSQMAAALMRHVAGDAVEVHSAGTHPGTSLNAESRRVVEEIGATFSGEHPKPVDPALLDSVDRVVVLGAEAHVEAPGRAPDRAPVEVWEIDEPSLRGVEGLERMRLVRDDILRRVRAQADDLLDGS